MTTIVMIQRDGKEETIATCTFGEDGECIFNKYKSEGRYHVRMEHSSIFGKSVESEFKPSEEPA